MHADDECQVFRDMKCGEEYVRLLVAAPVPVPVPKVKGCWDCV